MSIFLRMSKLDRYKYQIIQISLLNITFRISILLMKMIESYSQFWHLIEPFFPKSHSNNNKVTVIATMLYIRETILSPPIVLIQCQKVRIFIYYYFMFCSMYYKYVGFLFYKNPNETLYFFYFSVSDSHFGWHCGYRR